MLSAGAAGAATSGTAGRYGDLSLWWDAVEAPVVARPAPGGDIDVDIAIVGGGFTGLWTARQLAVADPSLRIAVLEAEVCGFGASGRNGGWCSALFSASDARLVRDHGHDAARRMRAAMKAAVDEVGRAAAEDGIDCHFVKGGTVVAARDEAQERRALAQVHAARAFGETADDLCWLGPTEAATRLGVRSLRGATFSPHCAALQPALLVRGLAAAVERRGVDVYEGSPVFAVRPGSGGRRPVAMTRHGSVRADVVVRAVEAWTATLPGERRSLAPVYSLMIATEPLDDAFWEQAGLSGRETFSDHRHLVIYGQRTADGRLAFGGRGAPYHLGSAVRPSFDRHPRVHAALAATLGDLFPGLERSGLPGGSGIPVTHRWGGPLGVPRDWHSSVGLDRRTGIAWAGGYVGDGVSTSNLAGRTLADLVTGTGSDLVSLPWVGHRSRRWEPEPLRWLGVNAGLAGVRLADRTERRRGRPSVMAAALGRLVGG